MANEIEIHLSTYLKDAGIKASKQQVEKLSQDIQKLNRNAQKETDKTVQQLGRLPGAFGKIQQAMGGVGAKAMAVIGAFKVGWDIGTWIDEKIIVPLFKIKDPIEEIKKKNRELKKAAEEAAQKWADEQSAFAASLERHAQAASMAVSQVDKLAAAYLRLQDARKAVADAGSDAEVLSLHRDKFEDMLTLGRNGKAEQAAQVGKYYDVLIAEEKKKRAMSDADAAVRTAEAEVERNEKALETIRKREATAQSDYQKAQARLKKVEEGDVDFDSFDKAKMRSALKAAQSDVTRAERNWLALAAQREDRERQEEALRVTVQARQAERANAAERAELEIDEKKKAYDDYLDFVEKEDRERAEDEWKKRQEEARKAAEAELQERQRVERQLAAERLENLRAELSERERAEGEARSRQSAAAGSLSTAWGWYRDQTRMQAVIDEQKAQAAAEVQWQKDFERLKTWRRDWRTADFGSLSAADEAVRQVAFAKEEKAAADRAVIETAENTRDLAEKIDNLLAMK